MRVLTSKSEALVDLLLLTFKDHLRVLHSDEDDLLKIYLQGSLESIGTFGDLDVMETVYTQTTLDAEVVDASAYTHLALSPISSIAITDGVPADVTSSYELDLAKGYIYPSLDPSHTAVITTGYNAVADIPRSLLSIVFRYGAHLYEHREAIQIGEPKHLPDWVNFALASILQPRV